MLQVALAELFTDKPATAVLLDIKELLLPAVSGECNLNLNELNRLNKYGEIKVCFWVNFFHIMFIYPFTMFMYISLLDVQIKWFANFLKGAAEKHTHGLTKITQLSTITTLIAFEKNLVIATFSEIEKLVRLFLTSPATSATAERCFSSLRRLRTYTYDQQSPKID